jgi:hypothetical protein
MTDVDNGVPEVTDNHIYDMSYHIHLYVHDHFRLGDAGCDRRAAPGLRRDSYRPERIERDDQLDDGHAIQDRHDDLHRQHREATYCLRD